MNDYDFDEIQTGYRIKIYDSYNNMIEDKVFCDTDWVKSNDSVGITIPDIENKLQDNSIYYWSVATMDKCGNKSEYSNPQTFITSMGDCWKTTSGIWASNGEAMSSNDFCFVRANFELYNLDDIDKIILSSTAISPEKSRQFIYNIYLNDSFVGMGPSRINKNSDSKPTLYYNSYDVTDKVIEGANSIGAILYTLEGKSFLSQLTAFYKNGEKKIIFNTGSDSNIFKSLEADNVFQKSNSIGTGYYVAHSNNIDSTVFPYGFSIASYDDSNWKPVYISNILTKDYVLQPYFGENVNRYYVDKNGIKVSKKNRSFIVDLGKEIVGGFGLEIYSTVEKNIEIRYGEELKDDGTVKYVMNTSNTYLQSWKLKKGYQIIETYDLLTYRYVEIIGLDTLTSNQVLGVSYHIDWNQNDYYFESDNELLNEIYEMLAHTAKVTTQDLLVDSQSRERAPYEGDVFINQILLSLFTSNYCVSRFTDEYLYYNPTWPAEYYLISTKMALYDYYETGDMDSLVKNYYVLRNKIFYDSYDSNLCLSTNGIVSSTGVGEYLYDWPNSERDSYDVNVKYNTIFNALSVNAYNNMACIADFIGIKEDSLLFSERASLQKQAMLEKIFDSETGLFSDGLYEDGEKSNHYSYHANAMALACGIYTDTDMVQRIADYLGGKLKTSVYFSYFVFEGLYNTYNGGVANKLLLNNDPIDQRNWAYMLHTLKSTITAEAWSADIKPNMTFSHPWGSSPAYAIKYGIFGIKPLEPGYDLFSINIQNGDINKASLKIPTLKGSIFVEFDYTQNKKIVLTIPSNSKAKVYIEKKMAGTIELDGYEVNEIYEEDNYYIIYVGSGTRTITFR